MHVHIYTIHTDCPVSKDQGVPFVVQRDRRYVGLQGSSRPWALINPVPPAFPLAFDKFVTSRV